MELTDYSPWRVSFLPTVLEAPDGQDVRLSLTAAAIISSETDRIISRIMNLRHEGEK